jgi:hypothetical protein
MGIDTVTQHNKFYLPCPHAESEGYLTPFPRIDTIVYLQVLGLLVFLQIFLPILNFCDVYIQAGLTWLRRVKTHKAIS